MATVTATADEVKREYQEIWDYWTQCGFDQHRRRWTDILNRQDKIDLGLDWLTAYTNGVDIQTYVLEEDRAQHVMILTLDLPRYDAIALEASEAAKEDIETNRIWHAASWLRQDPDGNLYRAIAQGLVQYGVVVVRKDWHLPEEPSEEELDRRVAAMREEGEEQENLGRDAERRIKAREQYFKERKEHCFSMEALHPFECVWEPLDNPTRVYQHSVISYRDAKRLRSLDGKRLSLDALGKLVLLGDSEPEPELTGNTAERPGPKVEVLIRDEQDPETGEWHCTEVVCLEGQDWSKDGLILNEYPNPLGRSRYFVIAAASSALLETNPHLRYRPMLYSEYVIAAEYNYTRTLLAALTQAQIDGRLVYLDGSRITPELAASLGMEAGLVPEMAGSQRLVARTVNVGDGEIAVLPSELKAWPFPSIEALQALIQMQERDLASVRPSRFGYRYGEAREPNTATQQLDNRQAEALPYSSYLDAIARFCEAQAHAEAHAILYWDRDTEGKAQKLYPVVTTGDEPLLKNPADPAKEVVATPDTFRRRYHIVVRINNVTQAEKIQNDLAADDAYAKGVLTEEQWLKQRGIEDPNRQIKELEKDRARKAIAAELEPVRMAKRKAYISALTRMDLMTPAPPTRAEEMGVTQQQRPAGNLVQAGPQMTPAPIQRPAAESPAAVLA